MCLGEYIRLPSGGIVHDIEIGEDDGSAVCKVVLLAVEPGYGLFGGDELFYGFFGKPLYGELGFVLSDVAVYEVEAF